MPSATPRSRSFRIGLVGANGYTGQIMHELLMRCMHIDLVCIDPRSASTLRGPSDSQSVPDARSSGEIAPRSKAHLETETNLEAFDGDLVVLAVPEEPAAEIAARCRARGLRVLDLSGAHRQQPGVHYGLPELFGAPPRDATLVANPGCYPTATLLVLAPLLRAGLIEPEGIAVVGASGASGAGKALRDDLHFTELHDNVFPYKVGEHRHQPEIELHLGAPVSFVTELLPVVRGILVTAFVRPKAAPNTLREALMAFYADAPYVSVLEAPGPALGLRHVLGTHQARLAVGPRERSGLVPVFATIDNLMRGAASQALWNLNACLGCEPTLGLPPPAPPSTSVLPGVRRLVP